MIAMTIFDDCKHARPVNRIKKSLVRTRCAVFGCTNHKGEGKFHGEICMPCWSIITTGKVGPTTSFLSALNTNKIKQQLK